MQTNRQTAAPNGALDAKTFAIGVLSITACVLLVGFVLLGVTPREAAAVGQGDRAGDYVMLTQQLSSSQEGILVVDQASRRLILYGFDYNNRSLEIVDGIELDRIRPAQERPKRKPR